MIRILCEGTAGIMTFCLFFSSPRLIRRDEKRSPAPPVGAPIQRIPSPCPSRSSCGKDAAAGPLQQCSSWLHCTITHVSGQAKRESCRHGSGYRRRKPDRRTADTMRQRMIVRSGPARRGAGLPCLFPLDIPASIPYL